MYAHLRATARAAKRGTRCAMRKTMNKTFSVDDEFGNQIKTGLESYEAALSAARRYLSAHADAPCVNVYDSEGEEWVITRAEALA